MCEELLSCQLHIHVLCLPLLLLWLFLLLVVKCCQKVTHDRLPGQHIRHMQWFARWSDMESGCSPSECGRSQA